MKISLTRFGEDAHVKEQVYVQLFDETIDLLEFRDEEVWLLEGCIVMDVNPRGCGAQGGVSGMDS